MRAFSKSKITACLISAFCAFAITASAAEFDTLAKAAWVYDVGTDTVLYEKDASIPLPPASMSKLMTLNMLFEALKDGRIALETTFSVSTKAREIGGSTMFLQESDRPTVAELIQGIIVNSGNDACVVVAEGLAGSEDEFAKQMTVRAKELGMRDAIFANASGWPHPEHRMSMRDLGLLAKRLIAEFPEYYHIFSQKDFNYKERAPANAQNRNPLLSIGLGADGLKTGHTKEAGYGLVGSGAQSGRRVIFVITGIESEKQRAEEAEHILNWSMRQFVERQIAQKNTPVAQADVWLGEQDFVDLVAHQDVKILINALNQDDIRADVEYLSPIAAPVAADTQVAVLRIYPKDMAVVEIPLYNLQKIDSAGFLKRTGFALRQIFAMEQ